MEAGWVAADVGGEGGGSGDGGGVSKLKVRLTHGGVEGGEREGMVVGVEAAAAAVDVGTNRIDSKGGSGGDGDGGGGHGGGDGGGGGERKSALYTARPTCGAGWGRRRIGAGRIGAPGISARLARRYRST